MKGRKDCIKARSPPTSLPLKGKVTKHTTVKWTIIDIRTCDLTSTVSEKLE